jgi:hypothetical protein
VGAAREGFVRTVHDPGDLGAPVVVDDRLVAVPVILVVLDRNNRVSGAGLPVGLDDCLYDVDDVFHSQHVPPTPRRRKGSFTTPRL